METWARGAEDAARFRAHLVGEVSVVAGDATGALGFASLAGDRVSGLYVRGDAQRRGVGGTLLRALVAEAERRAVQTLRAEASAFSLWTCPSATAFGSPRSRPSCAAASPSSGPSSRASSRP